MCTFRKGDQVSQIPTCPPHSSRKPLWRTRREDSQIPAEKETPEQLTGNVGVGNYSWVSKELFRCRLWKFLGQFLLCISPSLCNTATDWKKQPALSLMKQRSSGPTRAEPSQHGHGLAGGNKASLCCWWVFPAILEVLFSWTWATKQLPGTHPSHRLCPQTGPCLILLLSAAERAEFPPVLTSRHCSCNGERGWRQ